MRLYTSLLAGESWNICHIAFKILPISHSAAATPLSKAPCTTCKPHEPIFNSDGYSYSFLSSLRSSRTFQLVLGPSIDNWVKR